MRLFIALLIIFATPSTTSISDWYRVKKTEKVRVAPVLMESCVETIYIVDGRTFTIVD